MQIYRGQRRGQLPQIGGGRPDLGRQLAEAPVGRGHGRFGAGKDQGQALWVIAVRLDMNEGGFDDTGSASLRTATHRAGQLAQRKEPLVIGSREPFG